MTIMPFDWIRLFNSKLDSFERDLVRLITYKGKHPEVFMINSSPISIMYEIRWLIDYLKSRGYDTSVTEIMATEANRKLEKFIKENEVSYWQGIYEEFIWFVDDYRPEYIFLDGYEFECIIERRTDIEILATELRLKYDIGAYIENVREKDEKLKVFIPFAIWEGTYSPEDEEFIPESYWWRHLVKDYGEIQIGPII